MHKGTITSHGDLLAVFTDDDESKVRHMVNEEIDRLIQSGKVAVTNPRYKGMTINITKIS